MLEAVTFDAGFTLIEHVDPPDRFVLDACERAGVAAAAPERVSHALAEARSLLGDPERLWSSDRAITRGLRLYYGDVLRRLGASCPPDTVDVIIESYTAPANWRAVDGAREVLARLARRGLRRGVVANWQSTLGATLEACGLGGLVDAVVPSALVGAGKPNPKAFFAAWRQLGVGAANVLHVGDDDRTDGLGARAAGCAFVLAGPFTSTPLETMLTIAE